MSIIKSSFFSLLTFLYNRPGFLRRDGSFVSFRMRPKQTAKSSANTAKAPPSNPALPTQSATPPPISAPRSQASINKVPWSGIAAGTSPNLSSSNILHHSPLPSNAPNNPPMSFANAAAQSILRSTTPNSGLRSGNSSTILSRTSAGGATNGTLRSSRSITSLNSHHHSSPLSESSKPLTAGSSATVFGSGPGSGTAIGGGTGGFNSGASSSVSSPIISSTNGIGEMDHPVPLDSSFSSASSSSEPDDVSLDLDTNVAEVLRANSTGKRYTNEEMLEIWGSLKRSNIIKPASEPRTDLYFSATPNDPAILDHKYRQQLLHLQHHHNHHHNHHHHHHNNHTSNHHAPNQQSSLGPNNSNSSHLELSGASAGDPNHISSIENNATNSTSNSPMVSNSQVHQNSLYSGFGKSNLDYNDTHNNIGASSTAANPVSNSILSARSNLVLEAGRVGSPATGSAILSEANPNSANPNSPWSPFGNGSANNASAASNNALGDTNSPAIGSSILSGLGANPGGSLGGIPGGVPPGLMNTPPPPGIGIPILISPEQIEWVYKDMRDNEQGPFNALLMQEWFSKSWFQDDLLIRRREETEYYTLKDFMARVNNVIKPFLVHLPPVKLGNFYDQQQQQQENFVRQRELLLKHQLQQQQQQQQIPALQQFQQHQQQQQQVPAWGSMSPITTPMSPMSPWSQAQGRIHIPPQQQLGGLTDQNAMASANAQQGFGFTGHPGSQINLTTSHLTNDPWQRAPGSIPHTPRRIPSIGSFNNNNNNNNNDNNVLNNSNIIGLSNAFAGNTGPTNASPAVLQLNLHSEVETEDTANKDTFPSEISPPAPAHAAIQPPNKTSPRAQQEFMYSTVSPISAPVDLEASVSSLEEKLAAVKAIGKADASQSNEVTTQENEEIVFDRKTKKAAVSESETSIEENRNKEWEAEVAGNEVIDVVVDPSVAPTLVEKPNTELPPLEIEPVSEDQPSSTVTSPTTSTAPTKPVLAPWAKKETKAKPKTLSLKEIQEIDAAERKTRKAQQQAAAAILQASRAAAAAANTSSSSPALPSGATWASVGVTSTTPKKTLAQIQKEEEEAAKRNKQSFAGVSAASTLSTANIANSAASVVASGAGAATKRYADIGTASGAPGARGGAWTTVGPGGKKVGSAAAPTAASVPAPVASAAPSTTSAPPSRKPSVVATSLSSASPSNISTASEDFLNWCKGSLTDLHSGVNRTELLSMLLSLPASNESKEIIADTIYSNSTTMDGRRFADEFIKRRMNADSENNGSAAGSNSASSAAGGNWSDILSRTKPAAASSDGWNVPFKVVSKKKNRRE